MTPARIFLSPPHLSPSSGDMAVEAIASNYPAYPGPHITAFEKRFCTYTGGVHSAAMASGTAALHVAMQALGVGRGEVVLTSNLTFIGSLNPIRYTGAEPVLVDSNAETWNMDPGLLREAVEDLCRQGRKPKALVLVHLYGLPADLDPIVELCEEYNIALIEDAAEALGVLYKGRHVGTFGRVGCFSFNGNKIITNGGGGMAISAEKGLIDRMVFLATQARDPAPYYLHTEQGYNYRMSNILAAVGLAQMQVLDERIAARRRNYDYYRQRIGAIPGVSMMPDCAHIGRATFWLSCMKLDRTFGEGKPEAIRQALEAQNIETRRIWNPMHRQPLLSGARVYGGSFSDDLFDYGLCLPSGSTLTEVDLDRICSALEAELKG